MTAIIVRADTRSLPLADETVDLIVTSPPYYALRSYRDGGDVVDGQIGCEPEAKLYLAALLDATAEWIRVLRPAGSIFVNLGDKYGRGQRYTTQGKTTNGRGLSNAERVPAAGPEKTLLGLPWRYALGCMDELGLILRAEIIWDKPNGLPESVRDRVARTHEQWFHFTRRPDYYATVDELRKPYSPATIARDRQGYNGKHFGARNGRDATVQGGRTTYHGSSNPMGALPGSVWRIPTQPLAVPDELGVDHFAAFPLEWPRRIVRGWSPPAGIVLDPFGGTGSVALVAHALGRVGISVDLSHDYGRLARWRTTDPRERAKALEVEAPAVQFDGQQALPL